MRPEFDRWAARTILMTFLPFYQNFCHLRIDGSVDLSERPMTSCDMSSSARAHSSDADDAVNGWMLLSRRWRPSSTPGCMCVIKSVWRSSWRHRKCAIVYLIFNLKTVGRLGLRAPRLGRDNAVKVSFHSPSQRPAQSNLKNLFSVPIYFILSLWFVFTFFLHGLHTLMCLFQDRGIFIMSGWMDVLVLADVMKEASCELSLWNEVRCKNGRSFDTRWALCVAVRHPLFGWLDSYRRPNKTTFTFHTSALQPIDVHLVYTELECNTFLSLKRCKCIKINKIFCQFLLHEKH